jgi:hypothetical protein
MTLSYIWLQTEAMEISRNGGERWEGKRRREER